MGLQIINMKKYLYLVLLIIGIFCCSMNCGDDNLPSPSYPCEYFNEAIQDGNCSPQECLSIGLCSLVNSNYDVANEFLSKIPVNDPNYGKAQYGIYLAELQKVIPHECLIVGSINIKRPTYSFKPNQNNNVDLWEMGTGSILVMIKNDLQALNIKTEEVIANGYNLSIDEYLSKFPIKPRRHSGYGTNEVINKDTGLPLEYNSCGGIAGGKIIMHGRFGTLFARTVDIISHLIIAGIESIASHDLTLDVTMLNDLENGLISIIEGDQAGDLVELFRNWGRLFGKNSKFMTKSENRWDSNMTDVPNHFISAIQAFRELNTDLIKTAKPTAAECEDVICLISSDGAINRGDQLRINGTINLGEGIIYNTTVNCAGYSSPVIAGINISCVDRGILVDVDLTSDEFLSSTQPFLENFGAIISPLDNLLVKVEDSIEQDGVGISPADINPILTALDIPTLPEGLFNLEIKSLFGMPFRDLVGYFECGDDTLPGAGKYCFAIETEQVNVADQCGTNTTNTWCSKPYYAQGDSGHFSGVKLISTKYPEGISINIGPDGIAPKACVLQSGSTSKYHLISPKTLFYLGWGDTTLNGALKLDLSKLPAPFNANEPSGLSEPGNYEANKLINWMILDYAGRVEESSFFIQKRDITDIILNILPIAIPPFLTCP